MRRNTHNKVKSWWAAGLGLLLIGGAVTQVSGQQPTTPQPGEWSGPASFTVEGVRYETTITFTVDSGGSVTGGAVKLAFSFPGIPDEMLAAMKNQGCLLPFNTLAADSQPVAGLFASAEEAAGTFQAVGCTLAEHGDLQFVNVLTGIWSAFPQDSGGAAAVASPAEASAQAADVTSSPYDPPTHVNDNMDGRSLYKLHCDECHAQKGIGSEKAPPLEGLNAPMIAAKVREGPEDMDVFTHEELPDRQLNILIDYVLRFHPDSIPRTEFVITPLATE